MRRDLGLIRKILLAIEDEASGFAPTDLAIDGYSPEQVGYHAYLLVDAGLVVGDIATDSGSSGPEAIIYYLTWEGHEFAEAARDETRWKQAMRIVKDKGGSITTDVLKQLLGSLMRAAIGLP